MSTSILSATPQPDLDIHARVRKIGKIGRTLCTFLLTAFAFTACLAAIGAMFGKVSVDPTIQISKDSWTYSSSHPISIGFAAAWLAITVVTPIWLMRLLFVQFVRDEIFSPRTARLIKWLGICNLAGALGFSPTLLVSGLFLLALGWGMELAASLKQEQDLTV